MELANFLGDLLKSADVVAFGETHHGTHSKVTALLVKEIDKFDGIFDETPVNYQLSIDYYLETGRFDDDLQRMIQGAMNEGKDIESELKILLDAAGAKHLPVVCIDSSKVQTPLYTRASDPGLGHYFLRGKSRDEDMFTVIKDNLGKSGRKWCLIGGSQHIKCGIHFRSGDITLGSRLKLLLGNGFYNICLWKLNDEDRDIIKGEIECFNVRDDGIDPKLQQLMLRYKFNAFDEKNKLYFDGYILH